MATILFTATLVHGFQNTAPFTKGKVYDVVDVNDYFGTYTIIDDNGDLACVDWLRFADQGKASSNYQKEY